MSLDHANALFELGGAFFVAWFSIRKLMRDREVKGVSWIHIAFFSAWGFWNLVYYPSLEQWWSFGAGLCLVVTNSIYAFLLIYYGASGEKKEP